MAVNVITTANSRTSQLADLDANPFLLVAEGAYIVETLAGHPAYYANGGGANVTIKGTVITGGGYAGLYLGANNSFSSGGGNHVTVSASGLVEGNNAVSMFGGANSLTNDGALRGTGESDPGGIDYNRPGGVVMLGDNNEVINNGSITGFFGVFSNGANATVTNNGTITQTSDAGDAIRGGGDRLTINNSGTIIGDISTYNAERTYVENTGTIQGDIYVEGAFITNDGTITGRAGGNSGMDVISNNGLIGYISVFDGQDYVYNNAGARTDSIEFGIGSQGDPEGDYCTNDGTVDRVSFDISSDSFVNTGLVTSTVSMSDGDNGLTNSGTIVNQASMGSGADNVTNTGSIGSLATGGGSDTVVNAAGATIRQFVLLGSPLFNDDDGASDNLFNDGAIGVDYSFLGFASVQTGSGVDLIVNTGTITAGIDMGADADTFTNSGVVTGGLAMGDGADVVDTSAGRIDGLVDLGAGADTFTGGDARDRVSGGGGVDTVDLAGGDDLFRAVAADGDDDIDAGGGIDTYNGALLTRAFGVDLAAGATSGAVGSDSLIGFENAVGGSAGDTLTGSDGDNRLDGNDGADRIDGGGGADRLVGGAGADKLTGGAGRDWLTGGADADTFAFANGDSGRAPAARDVINDFTDHGGPGAAQPKGADLIDLRAIDANTTQGGNQAFAFNATEGAAFSGTAGSLIWEQRDGYALVSGDTNGDKVADFAIQLRGEHILFASDFML